MDGKSTTTTARTPLSSPPRLPNIPTTPSTRQTQQQPQGLSRNPYLYSLELAVYGQLCLGATMLLKALHAHHFTDQGAASMAAIASSVTDPSALVQGWTRLTWVPILTQACGGIIVGLVTKHAGGVKKGFSLIAGIALTAFVQAVVQVRFGLVCLWEASNG